MLKVTVMGPGGVGGYFGARLAAAGNDVTFVARGAHLDAMRARGLRLDSEIGPLHLQTVKVAADAREMPAADAVIFSVKMRDTEAAAESLRGLVGKGRRSSRSKTGSRAWIVSVPSLGLTRWCRARRASVRRSRSPA